MNRLYRPLNAILTKSQNCTSDVNTKIQLKNIIIIIILLLLLLLTAIGLSPSGSGYFICIQNMKIVTTKFKSGGLHEKHVVATLNFGNHLSICSYAQGNQENLVSKWPVAGPSEY